MLQPNKPGRPNRPNASLTPNKSANKSQGKFKAAPVLGNFDVKTIVKMAVPIVVAIIIIIIAVSLSKKEKVVEESSVVAEPVVEEPVVTVSDANGGYTEISLPDETAFKIDKSKFMFGQNIGMKDAVSVAEDADIRLGMCKVTTDKNCTYQFKNSDQLDISHNKGVLLSIKRDICVYDFEDYVSGKEDFIKVLKSGGATEIQTGLVFLNYYYKGDYAQGCIEVDDKKYLMRLARVTLNMSKQDKTYTKGIYTMVGIAEAGAEDYLDLVFKEALFDADESKAENYMSVVFE